MNKYKIIGIVNLMFGIPQLLMSIIYPWLVIPRLNQLYSDFNVSHQSSVSNGYLTGVLLLIIAILNIFLFIKGFSDNNKKYFKYGVISIIISLLTLGILLGGFMVVFVLPIYNLNSQF